MYQSNFSLTEIREILQAIMTVAISDFLQGDIVEQTQATQYFNGPIYQKHLRLLELPASWLPEEIKRDVLLAMGRKPQLAYVPVRKRD